MHDWVSSSSSSSSVLFNVLVMTNKVSRYGNKWWLKLFYWIWKWMLSPNLYIFKELMLCKYKLILITNYFSFFQTVLTKIKHIVGPFCCFDFWETISRNLGWLRTHYLPKDWLEFLILMALPFKCWHYRYGPQYPA